MNRPTADRSTFPGMMSRAPDWRPRGRGLVNRLLTASCLGAALLTFSPAALFGEAGVAKPVTPGASPEAVALLQLLYDISGNHILTGQHNYPNTKSRNSEFASRYIGKTPVIFGSDWGHAKAGDSDSYLARPDIVQEAIRQHERGSIVALCWHAVPPTANEPITFRQLPNSDPKALSSVQGKLLDEQFRDVLTPGTALYNHWCAQVDAVAVFLKQLQDAHVPVLWRPYHEMNGDWFWWGIAPPYWAFAWAGGQALARYILDSPWVVRGRNVLDFAAGSGIAGIAAALMGATHVEASDVDSMAAQAVALNAEGNGVSVAVRAEDVMAMPPGPWDVVLAGDICYEAAMTELCFPWLQRLAADGKLVLLSDPGRAYLPHTGLVRLAEYTIPTSRELEDRDSRETVIYQVEAKGLAAKAPE